MSVFYILDSAKILYSISFRKIWEGCPKEIDRIFENAGETFLFVFFEEKNTAWKCDEIP